MTLLRRSPAIVCIPYGAFTIFESLLPIPIEAGKRKIPCHVLLIGKGPNNVAAPGSLYCSLLNHGARVHRFVAGGSLLGRLWAFARLISLLLFLRIKHSELSIIYNEKHTSKRYDKWVNLFLRRFGKTRSLKANQGIVAAPFLNRLEQTEIGYQWREAMRAKVGQASVPYEEDNPMLKLYPGKQEMLMFSEEEATLIQERLGHNIPHTVIGLPRLNESWKPAMEDVCVPLLKNELNELGIPEGSSIILFAPTDIDCVWIRDERSNERMLDWLIQAAGKHMPDSHIVVKPKPRFKDNYVEILKKYENPKVHLSTCPLPIWTVGVSIAVVVSPSAAVFEFLSTGVPTIEVADYPDWYGPFGNMWPDTPGLLFAGNNDELLDAIEKIATGQYQEPDRHALSARFGHKDEMFENLLVTN